MMKLAEINPAVRIKLSVSGKDHARFKGMQFIVSPVKYVEEVTLRLGDPIANKFKKEGYIVKAKPNKKGIVFIAGDKMRGIPAGESTLWIDVKPSADAKIGEKITISNIELRTGSESYKHDEKITQPIGMTVAKAGQKVKLLTGAPRSSLQFRIPGIIQSKTGALIACFDARWESGADLCADIDVLTSRSTDGGQTWSPVKVALDIGEGARNGVGDPCILQDSTGRIWIQGLGAHFGGGACLFRSTTGQNPKTTGQWYMTYSDDDGKTWSRQLVNPTKQVKKDEWNCILAGPGNGITTSKGIIVFPAQIWQNGHKYRSRSTICYSTDHGKNWKFGEGVPHCTSECQVVELENGSIMINARNEARSGKRAVFVTKDLGKTWQAHETNLNTLEEPVCQASIISVNSKKYGKLLLFSNPKTAPSRKGATSRHSMTIRFSKDEGKTWSDGYLYDTRISAGYSCLTMIDEDYIGVLYESPIQAVGPWITNMNFQRIALRDIIDAK